MSGEPSLPVFPKRFAKLTSPSIQSIISSFFLSWFAFSRVFLCPGCRRAERDSDVILVLVGNKTDLAERRQVTAEEGEAKAKELGVLHIETSAKGGGNIKALFRKIASSLPGMETVSVSRAKNLVDVRLEPNAQGGAGAAAQACSC